MMTIARIEAMSEDLQADWWGIGKHLYFAKRDVTTALHDDLIAELYFVSGMIAQWDRTIPPELELPITKLASPIALERWKARRLAIETELRQRALSDPAKLGDEPT